MVRATPLYCLADRASVGWEHSGNTQGTFRENSGNIQGTFKEYLGNIQGTFNGTFREHSGNIQGTFRDHSRLLLCSAMLLKGLGA
jgi:hypothetical protein